MSLRKLRATKAVKPEPKQTGDMVNLETTEIKTGKVIINGPFEPEMLNGWMVKNAGGSVLSYRAVAI